MKIALFGQVNEVHVCDALGSSLSTLGHEVVSTGAVWHGHRLARAGSDIARIDRAVDTVLASKCEALFNFRASALDVRQLQRLRDAGVTTAVWLPDDPVLYDTTYRHVVDSYDFVLHCGARAVLEFYDRQGHRAGVNFPFWLDPSRWPHLWDPSRARHDLVFLGNLHGPAKRSRYELLVPGARRTNIYGICPQDRMGMHRGELHGRDAMLAVLPLYRAGLNIPQTFADYAGSAYDFAGLAGLGRFDLPSRIVQYAALGLPVISLGGEVATESFPHALAATDMHGVLRLVDGLRDDPAAAIALSRSARQDVESNFSGLSRARYLMALLSGDIDPGASSIGQREAGYRHFSGNARNGT